MVLQCYIWLSIFLCVAQICSMPMRCRLQRRLVETCLYLLESMGGSFPLQCFEDRVSVPFPTAAFRSGNIQQNTAIEKSIYTTLQYIASVFDNSGVPDQWIAQKNFDYFQHIIFRLIEENRYIMGKSQESPDDFLSREALLRTYFDKITTVLKEKRFEYCAWELARNEILDALRFLLKRDFHCLQYRRDSGSRQD